MVRGYLAILFGGLVSPIIYTFIVNKYYGIQALKAFLNEPVGLFSTPVLLSLLFILFAISYIPAVLISKKTLSGLISFLLSCIIVIGAYFKTNY